MKKRILSIVSVLLVTVMLIGAVPFVSAAAETATAGENPFTDISKNWAKKDILWAYENGIATGTSATTFSPSGSLSRGMFVCFLARLANLAGEDVTDYPEANPFADIKNTSKHWYYSAAAWAYDKGIVSGTAVKDGKAVFSPNNDITRQETASIFYRFMSYLGCKIGTDGAKTFPDGSKIQKWARESATALTAIGVFAGDAKGCFNPAGKADRATAVSLCRRIYNLIRPENENDPWIPCVGYSPLNYNTDDLSDLSFCIGRVRFTATLTGGAKVLLKAPEAAEDELKEINAVDYFEIDGKEHVYDVVWLDNNAVVFFCDGERVDVFGHERTFTEDIDAEHYKTTVQYQNPTCDVPTVSVSFENVEVKNPILYRAIDESKFGKHGKLHITGADIRDRNDKTIRLNGVGIYTGNKQQTAFYHDSDLEKPWNFTTYEELKWMRDDMGIDLIRIVVTPGCEPYNVWRDYDPGYATAEGEDFDRYDRNIRLTMENCQKLGLYVQLDWHGYCEIDFDNYYCNADPRIYYDKVKFFFDRYSKLFGGYGNVIYDLYNEITGGKAYWGEIDEDTDMLLYPPYDDCIEFFRDEAIEFAKKKGATVETKEDLDYWVCKYAWYGNTFRIPVPGTALRPPTVAMNGYRYTQERIVNPFSADMIETIRKNDPGAVCIIPTPEANQHIEMSYISPLEGYDNIMYSVHHSCYSYNKMETYGKYASSLYHRAVFVGEYGFYPEDVMAVRNIENTVENAMKMMYEDHEPWLQSFFIDNGYSGSLWIMLCGSDIDYRATIRSKTTPKDRFSAYEDQHLTEPFKFTRAWFRSLTDLKLTKE